LQLVKKSCSQNDVEDRTAGMVSSSAIHSTRILEAQTSEYGHKEAEEGQERPDKCTDAEKSLGLEIGTDTDKSLGLEIQVPNHEEWRWEQFWQERLVIQKQDVGIACTYSRTLHSYCIGWLGQTMT
jgi:hypothetical protein